MKIRKRLIPVLLLKGRGLYKGNKFKNYKYIGDPINTVRLFNEKEVNAEKTLESIIACSWIWEKIETINT